MVECEIDVQDYDKTHELLCMLNFKKFVTLDKDRLVYKINDYKLCFDSIKGWGDGLEIEKKSEEEAEMIKKDITNFACKLGLGDDDMPLSSFTREVIMENANW